jgi:hypothetical protein
MHNIAHFDFVKFRKILLDICKSSELISEREIIQSLLKYKDHLRGQTVSLKDLEYICKCHSIDEIKVCIADLSVGGLNEFIKILVDVKIISRKNPNNLHHEYIVC